MNISKKRDNLWTPVLVAGWVEAIYDTKHELNIEGPLDRAKTLKQIHPKFTEILYKNFIRKFPEPIRTEGALSVQWNCMMDGEQVNKNFACAKRKSNEWAYQIKEGTFSFYEI